jgi:hypothetical protein
MKVVGIFGGQKEVENQDRYDAVVLKISVSI